MSVPKQIRRSLKQQSLPKTPCIIFCGRLGGCGRSIKDLHIVLRTLPILAARALLSRLRRGGGKRLTRGDRQSLPTCAPSSGAAGASYFLASLVSLLSSVDVGISTCLIDESDCSGSQALAVAGPAAGGGGSVTPLVRRKTLQVCLSIETCDMKLRLAEQDCGCSTYRVPQGHHFTIAIWHMKGR